MADESGRFPVRAGDENLGDFHAQLHFRPKATLDFKPQCLQELFDLAPVRAQQQSQVDFVGRCLNELEAKDLSIRLQQRIKILISPDVGF